MAKACEHAGCGYTTNDSRIMYQCSSCSRVWCSQHARKGQRCDDCGKGYLEER